MGFCSIFSEKIKLSHLQLPMYNSNRIETKKWLDAEFNFCAKIVFWVVCVHLYCGNLSEYLPLHTRRAYLVH